MKIFQKFYIIELRGEILRFPKLKNALLCRILVYITVLGSFLVPIIIVARLSFIPIKGIICIGLAIGLLVYIVKNFILLMAMDLSLATLHCHNKARKSFALSKSFSQKSTERKISGFGKETQPTAASPRPDLLRYKSSAPVTVYSSGIEKIIAVYHTGLLDKRGYDLILNSAEANTRSLKGKSRHRFLDSNQKKAPLNSVTVIIIFAKRVEENFACVLADTVLKNGGDGFDTAVIPCVVDIEKRLCTFDSMKIPYIGYQYPVKNRGIKLIKKYLFNNRFTYSESPEMRELVTDIDPEQTLWDFWRTTKKELITNDRDLKKRFEKMKHREIISEDGFIYLKWEDCGIITAYELNEESKTAEADSVEFWAYPKKNKIAKDTIKEIQNEISKHFAATGYTVKYISFKEEF